ncbi:hypothetical protein WJ78_19835 [Burkholderia ubonensis]|uniref:hypothetical protein n=1 Tax=Burkholderia ubonensis TaxID=101571 RepID=UPI0007537016|nr:hypothetical protein [Burkholderia ubonensis]KVO63959.1 hypothetical protein WJ78_19835 [Burkholderia ubonensis]KVP97682.1 hypothetical protein WJ97_00430 [Burkholderia ubonensis]KVX14973.1 hypothetical protein WL03_15690 [Burkholderia ubonensis]OJB44247.1 hypothetical protein BGV57_09385 [Burkholderia ubonensis]
MKSIIASTSFVAALAFASVPATAETPAAGDASQQSCAIATVTGVGGSAQSLREYLATPEKYRYLADNPLDCKVAEDSRTSGCTGVTYLRHERVSVYDDSDAQTLVVVARVELERGTYPVIISVPRKDVQCVK